LPEPEWCSPERLAAACESSEPWAEWDCLLDAVCLDVPSDFAGWAGLRWSSALSWEGFALSVGSGTCVGLLELTTSLPERPMPVRGGVIHSAEPGSVPTGVMIDQAVTAATTPATAMAAPMPTPARPNQVRSGRRRPTWSRLPADHTTVRPRTSVSFGLLTASSSPPDGTSTSSVGTSTPDRLLGRTASGAATTAQPGCGR
jgi:hypothetical protein